MISLAYLSIWKTIKFLIYLKPSQYYIELHFHLWTQRVLSTNKIEDLLIIIIMEDQIITEQIDVIVIGDRKYQLMSLMLDQQFTFLQQKKKRTHQNYLQLLGKLVAGNKVIKEPTRTIVTPHSSNGISKFTKIVLTDSFWLHLHFFVHDNKLFDPFLFDASRGNITICIIAASQNIDLTETKAYLHQTSPQVRSPNFQIVLRDQTALVKPDAVIQGKILSIMHQTSVTGFPSVLALKITEEKRIIEESSNLRLTVNQISRWIVDRHFENKHKIKIKEQLGDQIENYQEKSEKSFCQIM